MRIFLLLLPLLSTFPACAPLVTSGIQPHLGKSFIPPKYSEDGSITLGITDPIEEDPLYKEIFQKAHEETERSLKRKGIEPQLGYIHIYWHTKKKILRKYGIDWKTPSELNPFVDYD